MRIILRQRHAAKDDRADAVPDKVHQRRGQQGLRIFQHSGHQKAHRHHIQDWHQPRLKCTRVQEGEQRRRRGRSGGSMIICPQHLVQVSPHKQLLHGAVDEHGDDPEPQHGDLIPPRKPHRPGQKQHRRRASKPQNSRSKSDQGAFQRRCDQVQAQLSSFRKPEQHRPSRCG